MALGLGSIGSNLCSLFHCVINVVDRLLKFNLELHNCVYIYILNQIIKF